MIVNEMTWSEFYLSMNLLNILQQKYLNCNHTVLSPLFY